jgi:hypothetical protein
MPGVRRHFRSLVTPPTHEAGELVELAGSTTFTAEDKQRFFRETYQEAVDRGYKPGWAAYRFKEKFGHMPVIVTLDGDWQLALPETTDLRIKEAAFHKWLAEGEREGHKPNFASVRFKSYFGHWPSFSRRGIAV